MWCQHSGGWHTIVLVQLHWALLAYELSGSDPRLLNVHPTATADQIGFNVHGWQASLLTYFAYMHYMQNGSYEFSNARSAMVSPLAKRLFRIDGITGKWRQAVAYIAVTSINMS